MSITNKSIEVVAQTIYGEARGEYYRENGGLPSLIAIANVICNRRNKAGEKLIENICLEPKQFSCWNFADPNYKILQNISKKDPIYQICLGVAENVVLGNWPDITKGSTHYYSTCLAKAPYWALGENINIKIGNHVFFEIN
ncbi:MAG: cell wall hydrolase [Holosporales bacterium]|jgi:spore germination cell wall hydrolase CwlJ-like protein|nr:cell wall hydrolase [Holosporales bacterium]